MNSYYFDSSALAKYYNPESGTRLVGGLILGPDNQVRISRLTYVEMHSVFALRVRMRVIARDEGLVLIGKLRRDLMVSRFGVVPMIQADFASAISLLQQYGFDQKLRTLDALQLSVAVRLRKQDMLDYFVAADKVLCEVAALEGLAVINPDVS